ncbi:unnamed protein product [Cuscuta campestris]|uniref:Uncharacterized protein n=1 Tax=Cuscuta campestris TaxID=132261 RepID=A0A484N1L2_9ASTE|nr:unnamed protein product [Cuscuta campestris]
MGRPKTVESADCDGKTFGPTAVYLCAWAVSIGLIISLICSVLTYYFRIGNSRIRNRVVLFTCGSSLVIGILLGLGMIYKKKMDGVCEIAHPAFLYITAVLLAVRGIVYCASLTCITGEGEETAPSHGGLQMSNIKGKT